MKKTIAISLTICVGLIVSGCYYDQVLGPDESLPKNVSFKNDVEPIFVANCSLSGCHDANPAHQPKLIAGSAYNSLISGHYVNVVVPKESAVYHLVASGEMPPSGPIGTNEVKIILAWITEGAKNN